jgi:hypothetical protein
MPNLIEWMNAIGTSGVDLTKENDTAINDYSPFAINRGMSQSMDTLMFGNEMNKNPWLSHYMQHQFLLKSISKKKRYTKWIKAEEIADKEDIEAISEYYKVNMKIAESYFSILSKDDMDTIRSMLDKGGSTTIKQVKTLLKKNKD